MHRYCFRRGRITFFGRVEGFDGLTVCLWGGIRLGVGRPVVARLGNTLTSSPLSPGTEATLIIGKPTIQEQIAHQQWHHKRSQAGGLLRVATPGYSLAECGSPPGGQFRVQTANVKPAAPNETGPAFSR